MGKWQASRWHMAIVGVLSNYVPVVCEPIIAIVALAQVICSLGFALHQNGQRFQALAARK